MIITYNVSSERTLPANISTAKLKLKSTLDKMSRRAYIFLMLLTLFAMVALLCNTYAGFRTTRVFAPCSNEAGYALVELTAASRDYEQAAAGGADSFRLARLHLVNARQHTTNVLNAGFQAEGLFSATLPREAADEAQKLLAGMNSILTRLSQLTGDAANESGSLEARAELNAAFGPMLMRATNVENMLQDRIDLENSLFRTSGILSALGILMLAVFAGLAFRRSDRLRTVQFDSSVSAEEELRQREAALKDRIKELNCLYRFSQIIERNHQTLDSMLTEIVQVIPSGWKHDLDAAARLIVGERQYCSANFRETAWMQTEPVRLNGQEVGLLQVAYLTGKPEIDEGPFSIEERALLKALAEQMDSLLHKYQLRDQLQANRRYEGIGALISGIAHDFNNILFAIMGNAEMALAKIPSGDRTYIKINNIVQATNRARDLTKQLISFTKPAEDQPDSIPVNRVVDEVLKLVRASLPSTIRIDLKFYKPRTFVHAQFTAIHQIILNLCSNAGYAMQDCGGTLRVSVDEVELRRMTFKPGGVFNVDEILKSNPQMSQGPYVRISVRDTGVGIPAEIQNRIFEPFFSTKPADAGTGMGLFNVREIVQRLNGAVVCESCPGEGSVFHVYLPSAPPSVTEDALRENIPHGSERILVVDDEQDIVSMLDSMLSDLGYAVTTFTDSRKALQDFAANPAAYDLLLTDLTMPDMTGNRLIDHVCNIKPGIPAIMMSGNDAPPSSDGDGQTPYRYLKKPVTKVDLANTIRRALGRQELAAPAAQDEPRPAEKSGFEVA